MDPSPVHAFVLALLDVGERLVGVVDNLVDGYENATGRSNEEATAEVLAMVFGTVGVRLASSPDEQFELATKLLRRTLTVVLADVEQAAELARQREFHAHPTSLHGRPL